jgi:hypothetical protein
LNQRRIGTHSWAVRIPFQSHPTDSSNRQNFCAEELARDLLVPIVHDTTYEALREVSPLLGSRSGLSTADEPMADIAAKLAELVAL